VVLERAEVTLPIIMKERKAVGGEILSWWIQAFVIL